MTEYVVLGVLLVIMGGAQMWLRWGRWAKEQQEVDEALAKRMAEASTADDTDEESMDDAAEGVGRELTGMTAAGSRLWNKWTAILGPLGILLGLFLLFWGIFAG